MRTSLFYKIVQPRPEFHRSVDTLNIVLPSYLASDVDRQEYESEDLEKDKCLKVRVRFCRSRSVANITKLFRFTFVSKAPTPIPDAAPLPDSPMKCSLPMLLANREAPTCPVELRLTLRPTIRTHQFMLLTGSQNMCRPARKKPLTVSLFFLNMD